MGYVKWEKKKTNAKDKFIMFVYIFIHGIKVEINYGPIKDINYLLVVCITYR